MGYCLFAHRYSRTSYQINDSILHFLFARTRRRRADAVNISKFMKKLLFLLVFATLLSGCGKDEIPDPNAPTGLPKLPVPNDVCSCMDDWEFMKYCYDNFDVNNDGKISRSEANAVIKIDLRQTGVRSITGIGYFSNLETFLGYDCTQLEVADLSNNQKIKGYSFHNCSSLKTIRLPNVAIPIGTDAFCGCSSLTSINIPDRATSIGSHAFCHCSSLTNITIGNKVTSIGYYAFYGCSSLTNIVIPDRVTSIGNFAFGHCSSLTNINIPNGVTSIGDAAFYGCSSLTNITIGDKVTSIGDAAFYGCSSLTSINIPDGVTSIGDDTFRDCSSLTNITIGNKVASIGNRAFYGCNSLTNINIPDEVTSIGYHAFSGCSNLTSITIGDKVSSIGDATFSGCSSLESVYCKPVTPPTLGYQTFGTTSIKQIYVPRNALSAYVSKPNWDQYSSRIVGYDF